MDPSAADGSEQSNPSYDLRSKLLHEDSTIGGALVSGAQRDSAEDVPAKR
jgi:hypothetical protein